MPFSFCSSDTIINANFLQALSLKAVVRHMRKLTALLEEAQAMPEAPTASLPTETAVTGNGSDRTANQNPCCTRDPLVSGSKCRPAAAGAAIVNKGVRNITSALQTSTSRLSLISMILWCWFGPSDAAQDIPHPMCAGWKSRRLLKALSKCQHGWR